MEPRPSTNMQSPRRANKSVLTNEDVQKLLGENDWSARFEIAQKVSSRYALGMFEGRELAVAEQIFRLLMKDTEVKVRAAMAEQLRMSGTLPRDLVLGMARDVTEVSVPVLEVTELLSDADLVSIIESSKEIERAVAIARRRNVSLRVSKALVDTGQEDVVVNLMRNKGADISEESYERVLSDFVGHSDVIDQVVGRANLPITVVEKLITLVSEKVSEELVRKYNIPEVALAVESETTREAATLKLLSGDATQEEIESLVDQLAAFRRLTPSIILTALCRGNFHFFELALARLSGIPVSNARALINDRGDLGFHALYHKAGQPTSMFTAVKLTLRAVQDMDAEGVQAKGTIHYANRVVERILESAHGKSVENLSYLIALVRQNTMAETKF